MFRLNVNVIKMWMKVASERERYQDVDEGGDIIQSEKRSPAISSRRVTMCRGVPEARVVVCRTLIEQRLYPFHAQHVQRLQPGDDVMRLEFCPQVNANRRLLRLMPFTSEATFTRDGIINTRNCHRWSEENPHATVETNFEHSISANLWCHVISSHLIGPVILEHRLTGLSYLEFLRTVLPDYWIGMCCQHDGAPPHSI
jgi:hypothetical protein